MDRVKFWKYEDPNAGGNTGLLSNGPEIADPQQKALEAAGIYIQDATHKDESVLIWRNNNNIMFKDGYNVSGITLSSMTLSGICFNSIVDDTTSTTTSKTYQTKLTLTTGASLAAGTYVILWNAELTISTSSKCYGADVTLDGIIISEIAQYVNQNGLFYPYSGVYYTTLTAGAHNIVLNYRSDPTYGSGTVSIRKTRLVLFRGL